MRSSLKYLIFFQMPVLHIPNKICMHLNSLLCFRRSISYSLYRNFLRYYYLNFSLSTSETCFLLDPRQTGKSTLSISQLYPLRFQLVGSLNHSSNIRSFPIRRDPPHPLVLPPGSRATPVAANHETVEDCPTAGDPFQLLEIA